MWYVRGNPRHTHNGGFGQIQAFLFIFFISYSGNDATNPICETVDTIVFFIYVLCSFLVSVAAPGLKKTMKKYKYESKKLVAFLPHIISTLSH